MNARTNSNSRKKTSVVIAAITSLLAVYFVLAGMLFPQFYMSLVQQYPKPEITGVAISNQSITLGEPLEITVVGTNIGTTSDMQTLSVSFPNMTDARNITVKYDNFTQHPSIIGIGQEVGSHYQGTQFPVYSKYPMVESYNRPWDGKTSHSITIDVTPQHAGRFLVLVKSVCLPYSDTVHYPAGGMLDQQSEYAAPYTINVTKP